MKFQTHDSKCLAVKRMRGVTLIDVLLAIVIFVIGMLALAHLQTNLTRSSTDANVRTVAASVGEEILEGLRAFRRVSTDPDGVLFAFQDIDKDYVEALQPAPRGGIQYTVEAAVKGYNFDDNLTSVIVADPAIAGADYAFKVVDLTVSWDNAQEFQVDEDTQAAMGTGSITISSAISSIPLLTAAKVAADDDGELGYVPTPYQPGQRPDIISIDLQNNKFKETTTPKPDVIRNNELVETWFDVITYLGQSDALFQRREEFLVVSCQCELQVPSGNETTGFLPTIWNGVDYTEGEFVSKNYGTSASNQNSAYCDVCCRDHHDMSGASLDQRYDPSREWTEAGVNGDHKHYNRTNRGVLVEATSDGDDYLEVCRMVRKDGFMRVAQDFRQEGFIAFPAGYLDTQAGAEEYAEYVVDAVQDFHENSRTELTPPDGTPTQGNDNVAWSYLFPGTDTGPTTLPTAQGLDSQQLLSRGIYIDHLSTEAATIVACLAAGGTGADCEAPGVDNYLEVFPFFEVQTTWLSWWVENSAGNPVAVANEAVEDNNAHDRGIAELTGTGTQQVMVTTDMHRGNRGLAVVDSIDSRDATVTTERSSYDLYVDANGGGTTPPPPDGYTWSGTFLSGVGGVNAADAALTPGMGTVCQRSGSSISCTTLNGQGGSVDISGYYKNAATSLWICASGIGITVVNPNPAAAVKSATVSWPDGTTTTNVVLTIENRACT